MGLKNSPVSIYSGCVRNCFRCGKDFYSFNPQGHTCKACYKPKMYKASNNPLGQPLTLRQSQIAAEIAKGKPNKEIAFDLHLSEGTVKVFTSAIFRRTGLSNRTELARWWILKSDKSHQSE